MGMLRGKIDRLHRLALTSLVSIMLSIAVAVLVRVLAP